MIKNKVIFKKPKQLDKDNCYVDMHFHSKYSDTITKVSSILKKARKKGIGVSITDHNEIRGSIEAYKKRVFVVPGIEVSLVEGPHILIYFYNMSELKEFFNKHVKNNRGKSPYLRTSIKFNDLIENVKKYNCITCSAHPVSILHFNFISKLGVENLKKLDAIEILCARLFRKTNLSAIELCKNTGKAYTGGSDGHALSCLGSVLTYSKTDNLNDFLDAIKKKKNKVIGKESNRIRSYSIQSINHIKDLSGYVKSYHELFRLSRGKK